MKVIFSSAFLSNLPPVQLNKWKAENNGTALNDSIHHYALEYVGKPINDFIR